MAFVTEIIYPEKIDFTKAIQIARKLQEIGKPVGAIDIINSSMCINRGFKFITSDKDYKSVKLVEPKFKLKLVK